MQKSYVSVRDPSHLSRWWWTIDRWVLFSLLFISFLGIFLNFAASPGVAQKLGLDPFFFAKRHLTLLPIGLACMLAFSFFSIIQIRRWAVFIYIVSVCALLFTYGWGIEIKGARRWMMVAGFSVQPSEFLKPAFAVLTGWMLAERSIDPTFPGIRLSILFLGISAGLLLSQPDLGMTVVVVATWLIQLFVAGMPFAIMILLGVSGAFGLFLAYLFLPHVSRRISHFLDPSQGNIKDDLYQVHKSLESFINGGLGGRGPGEGIIKKNLPDAHADFIFSVAGEEFGFIACILIVALFCFIVVRSLFRAFKDSQSFVMIGTVGLATQFGLQTLVNLASSLNLIPTKGMTLPFLSYGGSSLIALGIGTGMLLALTRKRHGAFEVI